MRAVAEPAGPLGAAEYERAAAEVLDPVVVDWFAGGAGDERTLRDNEAAFARRRLRPRVLVDVREVTAATNVLGTPVALPVLVAPTAFHRLAHPEGEAATAAGAARAGTVMCLSTMSTSSFVDLERAAPGAPRWLQLYHFADRGRTRALVDAAVDAGARALVLTVDAPLKGRRERDLRGGFRLPQLTELPNVLAAVGEAPDGLEALIARGLVWRDLERLVADAPLPVLVKGVLTGEDAALACEAGVAGVVVSNHGGRQLDGVPASLDVLEEVVAAVAGRAEVLVDGGVRRGTDVAIALALGARAVLLGRPVVWALAVDGAAGVERLLGLLREEVRLALGLLGCPSPGAVTRAHVAG